MGRLDALDRWILFTLVPLFAVCFVLHVRQAAREQLPALPVFAVPVWGEWFQGHPVVGGLHLERGHDWNDLRPGDRLIRVGDVDLDGVGYLGFQRIGLAQTGRTGEAPLVVERDGRTRVVPLRASRYEMPWARVPFLLSFGLFGTLILLGAPGRRMSRLMTASFLTFAIFESALLSSDPRITMLGDVLFHVGGPIALGLALWTAVSFPEEVDPRDRLSPAWALAALLFTVTRLGYYLGGPWPPPWTPYLVLGADVTIAGLAVFALTWNYFHAPAIGRRRIRWVVLGAYFGVLPVFFVGLSAFAGGELGGTDLTAAFQASQAVAALFPVGCLIAIGRANLFDVDRLLATTTAVGLLMLAGGAVLLAPVPRLAAAVPGVSDVQRGAIEGVLLATLAAGLVWSGRALGPRLSRALSRRARVLAVRFDALSRDLANTRTPRELMSLLDARLESIFDPAWSAVYRRGPSGFSEIGRERPESEVPWPGDGLPRLLERQPATRRLQPAALPAELEPAERARLLDRAAQIVVPFRSGKDLAAFALLGPKRSGDVYTATEIGLLEATAERASAELRRLRDADTIARERARAAELRASKEAAEQADRAAARFVAAAADELRQPLRRLERAVEALARHPEAGPAAPSVERIQGSTRAFAEMFDSVLDMSVLEAGALEADVREVDLGPLLALQVANLEVEAQRKGLALRFEGTGARARTDPALLARIVQNLLSNAVRYTDTGWVEIRCPRRDESLAIEVADSGPGISPERQREIFREFVQLEAAEGRGGLGLGLSIVDRLTRLLGHRLEVESKPRQGSVFRIVLSEAPSGPGR